MGSDGFRTGSAHVLEARKVSKVWEVSFEGLNRGVDGLQVPAVGFRGFGGLQPDWQKQT